MNNNKPPTMAPEADTCVCFVCLKLIDFHEKELPNSDNILLQLYLKFISFTAKYLKLPAITDSLKNRRKCGTYCEPCAIKVKQILELYGELCEVELRLSSRLGELGKLMRKSNESVMDESYFQGVSFLEADRDCVATKCLQRYEELQMEAAFDGWDLQLPKYEDMEDDEKEIKLETASFEENSEGECDPLHNTRSPLPSTSRSVPSPCFFTNSKSGFSAENSKDDDEFKEQSESEDFAAARNAQSDEESMSISESEKMDDSCSESNFSEAVASNASESSTSENPDEESSQETDDEDDKPRKQGSRSRSSTITRNPNRVARRKMGRRTTTKLAFICLQCGKGHYTESRLYSHLLLHEKNLKVKGKTCCFCYQSCVSEQLAELHLKRCAIAQEKPFTCEEKDCKESFPVLGDLNEHLKTHSSGQPIQFCFFCDWGFISLDMLKIHELVHTPKRAKGGYKCPECDSFTFQNVKMLQHHYNHKHGAKLGGFKCFKCDLVLASELALKNHIKKHENSNN